MKRILMKAEEHRKILSGGGDQVHRWKDPFSRNHHLFGNRRKDTKDPEKIWDEDLGDVYA